MNFPARTPPPLVVLQLSDSHLSADPQALYREQSADANLARLHRHDGEPPGTARGLATSGTLDGCTGHCS
ncbi:MAG TPA: hypothetical protein VK972_02905 [Wenzhouxiangella sp.]|nr:hypothetical protein [Wenzhouxiangella sp.]